MEKPKYKQVGCTSYLIRIVTFSFVVLILIQWTFDPVYSTRRMDVLLDASSVPIVNYCEGETYLGPQRNPLTVAHRALDYYDLYTRTHNRTELNIFLNNSDWLLENAVLKGNYSILEYHFPFPRYDLNPPWYSGMAQARALEALTQAYQITEDKKYLDGAEKFLNSFFIDVKDGGVSYKTPENGWWYELYAGNTSVKEPRVLNGMTFALLGINEYYQFTGDPSAKYLFDQGIIALKKNLPQYEYTDGNYSTYDDLDNSKPAPIFYHIVQTGHLGKLYNITGGEIFRTYFDKWRNFELPTEIAQNMNIYQDDRMLDINFDAVINQNNFQQMVLERVENNTPEDFLTKFRIKGDSGNKTANFESGQFYYKSKDIMVTIGDKIGSYSGMNVSFTIQRDDFLHEDTVKFVHGPIDTGWEHREYSSGEYYVNDNYNISVESNSSESVDAIQLYGSDGDLVVKQISVSIPRNSCIDSMEFSIHLR